MKKLALLLSILGIFVFTNAQSQVNTISGTIIDEATSEPIESASIRVLTSKDSTYVAGTVANSNGNFSVNTKPARYLVEISFIGYTKQYIPVNILTGNASLGKIYLAEDGVLLNEAVITAKAVDMQIKGDTIEYNADSYKVQQSAVVEDLLKKMPGVEVDSEGKITVNGKEVKKMLLDGKEFFSDDPKVASKNLPAAMVDKLQVLDRKSDMARMTGFDDGNEETVINLTIKPGMKEGFFGNSFGGLGDDANLWGKADQKARYETGAMGNYMRNNTQMTVIAGINNTNNAGFSDFASSMFSGNRPSRGMNFGGSNGVSKTINGGFNFATEYSDKIKWGGDIRYGSIDNDVLSTSQTQYTVNSSRSESSISRGNNKSDNFGANMRFEWQVDSVSTIIFRPSLQYNTNDNIQQTESQAQNVSGRFNNINSRTFYSANGNGINLSGTLEFSRKLNSKGRTLSASLSGGLSDSESDGNNESYSEYFISGNTTNIADSIPTLDQRFNQDDKSHNWRVFLSYVEPLGRNNFLQLSYNISNKNSLTDKKTYTKDAAGNYTIIDNEYTRKVDNEFLNQNVTLSFKAVRAMYDYTIGVGLEPSSSKTDIYEPGKIELVTPRKNFLSFAPSAQFNYRWDRRHNLRLDYKGSTNQPSTLQLYDGIISNDGVNITRGNVNLSPSFEHRLNIRFQKFNTEKASSMMLFGRITYTTDDIVTITDWNDNGGRDMTYANINGNMSGNLRWINNLPLRNRNFTINSMSYGSYSRSNTYTSTEDKLNIKNTANDYTFSENAGISFRSEIQGENGEQHWLLKNVDLNLRGNITYQNIRYSATGNNNRETFNYGGTADFSIYFQKDFTVQTDLAFSTNSGYSDGFKQKEWLWNASLSKDIFPAKNGTIRLKVYDILNQRNSIISRQTRAEGYTDVTTNTISSYFMLSFVYKFQFFKGGVKRTDMEDNMFRGRDRGPGGNRPRPF